MVYQNDRVYRPPTESESVLLEVADGCSYGKCTFCRSAANEHPLCLVPDQTIRDSLSELGAEYPGSRRLFLLGSNVLAFKTEYLVYLLTLIHEFMPSINAVSMYARANDINNKTDEQLLQLRELGMDTIYVGVESGSEEILRMCKKGVTPAGMLKAFGKLERHRIPYGISCIIGIGGKGTADENALATARFLNCTYPQSIRVMTLTPFEGTPLYENIHNGSFTLQETEESLQEEILMLESLELGVERCLFVGNHVSNAVPVAGYLPRDKEKMIQLLKEGLDRLASGISPDAPLDELEKNW